MSSEDSQGNKKIAVIGLGFVGLPLSVMLSDKGFHVTGIDKDQEKINKLLNSKSYIGDIDDNSLKQVIDEGYFRATTNFDEIKTVDSIIICVPTPLTNQKTPDLSFIISAGNEIQERLQKGQLVILESSTFPGTTKDVLLPILEDSGLQVGTDFFLANSPERIDPGNDKYSVEEIPKVIGGTTKKCLDVGCSLYKEIYKEVVPVSSTEAAELTKLLENTFRFINISFINEMAILCEKLKVDIWEVVDAASTKPYGFTPFYPGPGIGGHCIPVDPFYLQWKLQQLETNSQFIVTADLTNSKMVNHIVDRTLELLNSNESPASANVLVYGITYKKDVADTRDSAAIEIIEKFKKEGVNIHYHDPFVSKTIIDGFEYNSTDLTKDTLHKMDCIVILTDHSEIPLDMLIANSKLVFDTRNITKYHKDTPHVIRLGNGFIS